MTSGLEERYNVSDALAVGTYLNIFVRNCGWVKMANLAQLVNAIAPIVTTPTEATVQPIFYPFLWHSQGHLDAAVDVYVDGPFVDPPSEHLSRWPHRVNDLAPFNLVDAAATSRLSNLETSGHAREPLGAIRTSGGQAGRTASSAEPLVFAR